MKRLSLLAALIGLGVANGAMAADCPGLLTVPTATASNSVTFGDGIVYALPILGLDVQSSPGQIQDCIVVMTGTSGVPVSTNFAGMDNAYATPSGTGGSTFFRTGDPVASPDPDQVSVFVGDQTTTWDTRLSALSTFLAGNGMVVYFNHNQTNSGSTTDQNLFIWAQIALEDDQHILPTLYFYVTSVPNSTGLSNFGQPGGDPLLYTGPQTAATCTYPTGTDSGCTFPHGGVGTGTGSGDASVMVLARGQVCLNGPVGVGQPVPCDGSGGAVVAIVNNNLGADHVAYAVVFPEINTILATAGFLGYDVLHADIRMGCNALTITGGVCPVGSVLNNGYEQAFIGTLAVVTPPPPPLPEPASLALLGIGLAALAFVRRGRVNA